MCASRLSQSIATHTKLWYLVDAQHQVVGRLATMISLILQGKRKPIYHPSVDMGDHVVVTNTKDVVLTGKKWDKKLYRHHTGYPGGLKELVAKKVHEKDPTKVLWKAVYGMLPKNRQRKHRMRRLHLFAGPDHPYGANISHHIPGPCPVVKRLEDYTREELTSFPDIVKVPHM